jgi:hypothetical protein
MLGSINRTYDMNRQHSKYNRRYESLFFIAIALAMMFVVFVGFARSFFLSFLWPEHDPYASSEPVFYVHGTIFAAWMAFAVVQPTLVGGGSVKWHRRFGWVGALLAIFVVLLGILVALLAAARPAGSALPVLPLNLFGVIASGILMFGLLVGLAVVFRRDAQSHKRLMLLATINLLQAPIARMPLAFVHNLSPVKTFLLAYVFILPLVIWDISVLRRIHPVTLWGGLGIIASLPLRFWMSSTETWLTVARWAVHLVHLERIV